MADGDHADTRPPGDWKVRLQCGDWATVRRVSAENACRTGLFLLTTEVPPLGSIIELELELPDGTSVQLFGRVRQARGVEQAAREGRSAGIGVQIDARHAVDLLVLAEMASAAEATVLAVDVDIKFDETEPARSELSQPYIRPVGKISVLHGAVARVAGLDFGSAMTRLACVVGDRPQLAAALPAVVAYPTSGAVLVGANARTRLGDSGFVAVAQIKRLLGKDFQDGRVTAVLLAAPFVACAGPDGQVQIELPSEAIPATQIAAVLVDAARAQAERFLRRPVKEAILTVPVDFGDSERMALQVAAEAGGLQVAGWLDEPVAAALAAGVTADGVVAVADFGAAGLQVTLLEVSGGRFRVLAHDREPELAGDEINALLAHASADQLQRNTGVEIREDPQAWSRLLRSCEEVKCALSTETSARILVEEVALRPARVDLRQRLTRTAFAVLGHGLVERAAATCRRVLERGALSRAALARTIVTGAAGRLDFLRAGVVSVLGDDPAASAVAPTAPDEAVAFGAALRAADIIRVV